MPRSRERSQTPCADGIPVFTFGMYNPKTITAYAEVVTEKHSRPLSKGSLSKLAGDNRFARVEGFLMASTNLNCSTSSQNLGWSCASGGQAPGRRFSAGRTG